MKTNHDMTALAAALRRGAIVALAVLAACSSRSSGGGQPASVQSLSVAPLYLAAGDTKQATAVGRFSDGKTAAVTAGLRWSTSDAKVATVDAAGVVTAVGPGAATLKVSQDGTGLTAEANVTARTVTGVQATSGEAKEASRVEVTRGFYRLSGLTPGGFYTVSATNLTDDVDLQVYGDLGLAEGSELCVSEQAGLAPEACVAPASAAGELYAVVDGSWSEAGASFVVAAAPAPAVTLAGTVGYPAGFPLAASVGAKGEAVYKVTGLAPGARYEVRLTGLQVDLDLDVYGDAYLYGWLCGSYASGTVDDACTAAANAAGELYVDVDADSAPSGGAGQLTVKPAP